MKLTLNDGTPLEIRLCCSEDKDHIKTEIRDALNHMSVKTRCYRFAAPIDELSDSQLEYLSDLDNKDRLAWGVLDTSSGSEIGIALARYVRLEDEPHVAEFAITIIDKFQGRGLGTILLKRLIDSASSNGIQTLRGYVHPENAGMIQLGKKYNAKMNWEASTYRIEIDVDMTE